MNPTYAKSAAVLAGRISMSTHTKEQAMLTTPPAVTEGESVSPPGLAPDATPEQEYDQVCGNYFNWVRDGEMTLADVDARILAWVKNRGLPWKEGLIEQDLKLRAWRNVTEKGNFPASAMPEGERPKDYWNMPWFWRVRCDGESSTVTHDLSQYAGMETAEEIAAREAARQEKEDDLRSLARMRKGKGQFPSVGDCKICLVKIANRMSEGIENPENSDDYEDDDEGDDDRTTNRSRREAKKARAKELENAQQKYDDANYAASERANQLWGFLENNVGGCCLVDGETLAKGEGASCYGLMAFAPDSAEQDIASLMKIMQRWEGAFVSWNMEHLKGRKLSLARIRAAVWGVDGSRNSPMDDDESNEAWIARIATSSQRVKDTTSKLIITGGNPELANELGTARFMQTAEPVSCLVEGLIPHAAITLIIGKRKSGKSTLLTELGVCIARCDAMWAGFRLPQREEGPGAVLLFCGEDSGAVSGERIKYLDPDNKAGLIRIFDGSDDLKKILAKWEKARVSLVVIDPMRKYLAGDEDGSNGPSEFMGFLEDFAKKTGAAVVIAHHMKRGSSVSSLSQVVDAIRGSGAIADRPRVILGLIRHANGLTGLGIAVDDGQPQHNIPPSQPMFEGERLLQRDAATQRHLPKDPEGSPVVPDDTLSAVCEAIERLTTDGNRITQTGKHELFMYKAKAPKLAGKTRAMVRDVVAAGLASGRLVLDGRQVRCA
jgi:AAA domain